MRLSHVYGVLAAVGTVLPLWQLLPFIRDHGLAPREFVQQLFATSVSGFFALDVIVSAVVLWVFVFVEGRRLGMKHLWAPVLASLLVGGSLGLPLFLYMRESYVEKFAQIAGRRAGVVAQ
jgi:hypothetical protein